MDNYKFPFKKTCCSDPLHWLIITFFCYAQLDQITHPHINSISINFHENGNLSNGKLLLPPGKETISASLSVMTNGDPHSHSIYIEGFFVSVINGIEKRISEPLTQFWNDDFPGGWASVPKFAVLSFPNESDKQGRVMFKVRSRIAYPRNETPVHSDYHYIDLKEVVTSPFKEVSTACDEKVVDIYNGGYYPTLNYDATKVSVTDLGNHRFKLKALVDESVNVSASIKVGFQTYSTSFSVGQSKPLSFTGTFANLNWSSNYVYSVNTENEGDILEIVKEGAPTVTFTRTGNNTFTLTTPAPPPQTGPIAKIYVLVVKARVVNSCGETNWLTQEITVGSGIPLE